MGRFHSMWLSYVSIFINKLNQYSGGLSIGESIGVLLTLATGLKRLMGWDVCSIVYVTIHILLISLLILFLFLCPTTQCHLGTWWDESKYPLKVFGCLREWHLGVTSRGNGFSSKFAQPWSSAHAGGLFLGLRAGWHNSMATKVKRKHCSPPFPLLLTEVLRGRVHVQSLVSHRWPFHQFWS